MARYKIESVKYPQHRPAARESDMAILLERVGHRWPDAGMPARMLTAIGTHGTERWEVPVAVWVTPTNRQDRSKSSKHRVMCKCPGCGKDMSVGRLVQHVCRAGE